MWIRSRIQTRIDKAQQILPGPRPQPSPRPRVPTHSHACPGHARIHYLPLPSSCTPGTWSSNIIGVKGLWVPPLQHGEGTTWSRPWVKVMTWQETCLETGSGWRRWLGAAPRMETTPTIETASERTSNFLWKRMEAASGGTDTPSLRWLDLRLGRSSFGMC
jgi:hypothetical protein